MNISQSPFGQFEGREVDLYTLENDNGVTVKITNYGGIVTSLVVPDKDGNSQDIVCGFDTFDEYFSDAYKANSPYFGCIVGRYAGRIKDGRFSAGGQDYQVATNDGPNHLHGGIQAFDKRVWDAEEIQEEGSVGVRLTLLSPDGEEGYPGNLQVTVTCRLNNDNELSFEYEAETDKATPLSLTNHTYFNLNGFKDKVLDHQLTILADKFLVPDETNVPVGDQQQVAGTVWDFNSPKPLGTPFSEQAMGFEHYYVFSKASGSFGKVAEVTEESSGRTLEVSTSEPGMLFYSGFYTSDELIRSDQAGFGQFKGFCCETGRFPNGPNIDGAPDSVLAPGELYRSKTVFCLSW